jgi:hypothetical protein
MWIYLPPSKSSPSVPVQEQETSASDWQFQRLAQSATWRGKRIAFKAWSRKWKPVPWLQRLYGAMCPPSTAAPGIAEFISSLPRIPASPSATPVKGKASTTRATSGHRSTASSRRSIHPSCSSRTSEGTLPTDSIWSTETWRKLVISASSDSLARRKWGRRMRESGCSLWPTSGIPFWPTSGIPCGGHTESQESKQSRGSGGINLDTAAENWPTPDASPKRGSTNRYTQGNNRTGRQLKMEAENWQTPQGRDYRSGEIEPETAVKHLGSRPLNEEVLNWGTPRSSDKGASGGRENQARLPDQVANWGTPRANDAEGNQYCSGRNPGETIQTLTGHAEDFPSLPTEPETSTAGKLCWCNTPGCALRSHKRRLNVWFDEWLMNWPVNWSSASNAPTGLEQWEMESSRLVSQWLSEYWRNEQGSLFADSAD